MGIKQVKALLLVAALYVLGGKAALLLALPPGYASAVFPPAGIAIAAVYIAGNAMLPAVLLGSFLLNLWTGYTADHLLSAADLYAAGLIALSSVLQAVIGGWALRRAVPYPAALDNVRDISRLLLIAPAVCLVSATFSVSGLWMFGILSSDFLLHNWFAWWIGDSLGVMLVFPVALALLGEPRELWRGRIKTVALPMLLLLALIVGVYLKTSEWEHEQSLAEFRQISMQSLNEIYTRLDEQSTIALEMSGLFAHDIDGKVTREEFHRFAQVILDHFPVLQALEWAPRVEAGARKRFEAERSREIAGFRITERNEPGKLQTAGNRDFYYPVTYLEPYAGNEQAVGYDLSSNPLRRDAVSKTVQTGLPAATAPITLVQQGSQQGMLIIQSVTSAAGAKGVVLTVLKMQDFIEKVLPRSAGSLRLRLIDDDAQAILYDGFPQNYSRIEFDRAFEFGSRHYRLQTTPTAAYLEKHRGWQSWGVLAMGAFGSSLLGALLLLGTGYTARVTAQVDERTRELQESEERFHSMADSSPMFIWVTGKDHQMTWCNHTLLEFVGHTLVQVLGGAWVKEIHPEDLSVLEDFVQHAEIHEPFQTEFRLRRKDGEFRWILDSALPRFDKHGNFLGYVGSGIDITERKQATELVRHMAHYDNLTGLPNRAMFLDRLNQALVAARRESSRFALMFIDIDNFKPINDELGHQAGDQLLVEIAARMKQCVRESDTVARIGGDEFVAILPALNKESDALQVAEKIRQTLCHPFVLEGQSLNVTSSIGIAIYPEHGVNDTQLIRNADHAMYQAKKGGRNTVKLFQPEAPGERAENPVCD